VLLVPYRNHAWVSELFGVTCPFKVAEFAATAVAAEVVTLDVSDAGTTVSVTAALAGA